MLKGLSLLLHRTTHQRRAVQTSLPCSIKSPSNQELEVTPHGGSDFIKLWEFFEGCHDTDVCSGKYKCVLEGNKAKESGNSKGDTHWNNDDSCNDIIMRTIVATNGYNCKDDHYHSDYDKDHCHHVDQGCA